MKKIFALLALTGPLLVACSSSDSSTADAANTLTFNNFESSDGWIPASTSLTRDQAHSGKYSAKVDGATEFSIGYNNMMGKMHPTRLRKIKLQAWAFLPNGKSQARLGIQIVDPVTNKEVFGDGITLTDQVKSFKKWVEISKEVTLPETVTATQVMKLFLWRAGAAEAAYIDDVSLSIVE